ncbi:MAG TPA: septal ring lytic transglycosylase RlpA family protein [Stellaceae bacterium]|nr:septal ring lytic transglycosylase RlpA family protein [Stellaceae bacterium]
MLPAVLALGLLLAGCASSGPQFSENHSGHHVRGQPIYRVDPYEVKGVWYYPRADYNYDETGIASWYGPGFDQHTTADNEIYDMNQLSAAHKTLPLPSVVEVTNLQNGRSVRLRVNDRGPFVDGRIIDLSRRAAQLLGYETTGTARVRVRILKEESIQVAEAAMHGRIGTVMLASAASSEPAAAAKIAPRPVTRAASSGPASLRAAEIIGAPPPAPLPPLAPPPAPAVQTAAASSRGYWPTLIAPAHAETLPAAMAPAPRSGRIFVQAGTFAVPANAQRVRARIAALGSVEIVPVRSGAALYRVRLGPVANEAAAARLLREVVDSGYPGARVVSE